MGNREKYINPFTDYGFKRLFGEEPNKDLLLDFLNELLKEEEGRITEIAKLKPEEYKQYEASMNAYRDIKNSIDTAFDKGKVEGKIEVAKNLLKNNVDIDIIVVSTGLTKEEIENLNN